MTYRMGQIDFRASIDPDEDVAQLQQNLDARTAGCVVTHIRFATVIRVTFRTETFPKIADYLAGWCYGEDEA